MLIHYEWLELHRAGIAHTIIDVQVESPILTDDKIQQKAETLPNEDLSVRSGNFSDNWL